MMAPLRLSGPLSVFLAFVFITGAARAQDETTRTSQAWLEYDPAWNLSERWKFDVEASTRLIKSDPSFWQLRLQPNLQFSPWKWMDLTGGVWFIYTNQLEMADLFETRPNVGVRFKHDIWRGVNLNNYLREELRIQRDLETGQTTTTGRLRNRIQAQIPINKKSLSEDNTWYAIVDAEFFWQRDQVVDDGFNSRRRYRMGIAWRKNSTWTFQFLYIFQHSRESASSPFSVSDDIFNFRVVQNIK